MTLNNDPSKIFVKKTREENEIIAAAQFEKRRCKLFFFAICTSRKKAKFEPWPTSLRCLLK